MHIIKKECTANRLFHMPRQKASMLIPDITFESRRHNRRAFSLVEFAIVMAVAGVIVAGIWVYAAEAWEKIRVQKAEQEITTVVQNVRNFYAGQVGVPTLGGQLLTAKLAAAGIFPSDMLRTSNCGPPATLCPDAPWGSINIASGFADNIGTFRVCDFDVNSGQNYCRDLVPGGQTLQTFAVDIQSMPLGSCVELASTMSGPDGPPGLIDVFINGISMKSLNHGLPVAQSDALTNCTASHEILFIYRLRN